MGDMMATNSWSDRDITKLVTIIESSTDYMTTNQIADAMNMTKNMIIGKLRRLKLQNDSIGMRIKIAMSKWPEFVKPTQPNRQQSIASLTQEFVKRRRIVPPPRVKPMMDDTTILIGAVTFEQLQSHHCRFPVTHEGPHQYCGMDKIAGSSYCEQHHTVTHVPLRSRQE